MSPVETSAAREIARLRATLQKGDLPEAQKKRGAALLDRLTSPVRLTILGLPGSGKSEIVNTLLGRRVLPAGQGMPTCRLVWGAHWKCIATGGDGSINEMKWPISGDLDWKDIGFVQVEAPIDLLKSVSILEVVSDGTPEMLGASIAWAIANTDMAIWCTQEMTRLEQSLWSKVPDALKDHAFLAMPKADQLAATGKLPERIAALAAIAESEFYGLFPVATPQYLAALTSGRPVDAKVRAASGAGALIDAVFGDVRSGRQADLDAAEVFLGRYGVAEAAPEPAVPAESRAQATPAAASPAPPAAGPAAVPAKPAQVAATPRKEPDREIGRDAPGSETVLESLRALGRDLGQLDADDPAELADEVLLLCSTRFEDMVAELPAAGGAIADEIEAASEAMILMQLEGDVASAADAATVVLQLARELEFAIAA